MQNREPTKFDLADIERDAGGVPTFVFKDSLRPDDKPTLEKKTLEVVLLWRESVMSVGHYPQAQSITIGDSTKSDFRISADGIPVELFHLLDSVEGEFVINWTDSMVLEVCGEDGDVQDQDEVKRRHNLYPYDLDGREQYQYLLGLNDRVAVQIGEITFVLQYVSPARLLLDSVLKTIDFYFTKILSLSFVGHLFVALALLLTPLDPVGLSEDLFKNPNRFVNLVLLEPKPKEIMAPKKFELSSSTAGAQHKDKEGKFGKPKENQKDALASTRGAPTVDPNKRECDRKIVHESPILKALSGGKEGALSNVLGPGGLGTGINNALGGLRGRNLGDAGGAGGLGTRGTGPGGGGNSLGIGGLGSGNRRGTGGLDKIDLSGRRRGKDVGIPIRTVIKGCLSKAQVGRVLNRIKSQVRYCYEKELPRDPNLAGKIVTQFVVAGTGLVRSVSIEKTTMNDSAVEQCIVRVLKRLIFPPCPSGGVVEINYPWIFKSGGG
ncbi:AgmX/PglI C-terminal domain-containing protein [Myxococcota bacterium]|nr:AgmX/PglI C-terminal domain-containing protein [Myxococcota bacterium]